MSDFPSLPPVSQFDVPMHRSNEVFDAVSQAALIEKIKKSLVKQDAVLIAHYYTSPEIQALADQTGGHVSDSLDMAKFGYEHSAKTLLVAGVRFMGETAKILNPEKRVIMPTLEATCSLDLGCPQESFYEFCDQHPDYVVVVYANTSAAIKARADWMVTSGTAVDVVTHLKNKNKKVLWAPDRYLGQYVQEKTQADMLIWNGSCVVHEEFKYQELKILKQKEPNAEIIAHPESPQSIVKLANFIGSTSALINRVKNSKAKKFLVATDKGIFYKMQQSAPDKILIAAPTAGKSATCKSCGHCPWMAMNDLKNIYTTLQQKSNEIVLFEDVMRKARVPIKRLLDFSQKTGKSVLGNNDA